MRRLRHALLAPQPTVRYSPHPSAQRSISIREAHLAKLKTKKRRKGAPRGRGFQPGQAKPPGSGRKPGSKNKFTRDVKEAILDALEELGGSKWLVSLAKGRTKGSFATLLGKAMPLQVLDPGSSGKEPDEVARAVRQRLAVIEDATGGDD